MHALVTVFLMALCAAGSGAAPADNCILAMRGQSPNGRIAVNHFHFAGGRKTPNGPAAAAIQPGDYVGWKDKCVRMPRFIAGQSVEFAAPGGFASARPVARTTVPGNGEFAMLLDSLTVDYAP